MSDVTQPTRKPNFGSRFSLVSKIETRIKKANGIRRNRTHPIPFVIVDLFSMALIKLGHSRKIVATKMNFITFAGKD